MERLAPIERTLALCATWGVLGSFGLALILSGFVNADPVAFAAGSGVLVAGYFVHLLVNWFAGWRHRQAFVSFRWFWALVLLFIVFVNLIMFMRM